MGTSFCFSSASILRCIPVSRLEAGVLLIPTALETIFSTTLVIAKRGDGRKHILLAAEGWTFFFLAFLDALSHIVPAARDSIRAFRIIDMVIASTSSVTIILYTVYLWLLVRDSLLATLPQRFQKIPEYMLLIFIPAIIILHEIASFIGISYRQLPGGNLIVGFSRESQAATWMFFTSFTLALLMAYQAIVFCLTFYRLTRALINQRNIDTTSRDSNHLIRGTGWIAGGLKIGAFETVAGFVQLGFGVTLTRRLLRFLSRAFLIIGVIKGIDSEEDFAMFNRERPLSTGERRRSRLLEFISNPRPSTFRRLSPTDTTFQTAPIPEHLRPPTMRQYSPNQSPYIHPTIPVRPEPKERVTVHLGEDRAPVLQMSRFSSLGLLSPSTIVRNLSTRSNRTPSPREKSTPSNLSHVVPDTSSVQTATSAPSGPRTSSLPSTSYHGHQSLMSNQSLRPESLRELAVQFPSLPNQAKDMRRSSVMARYFEQIGRIEEAYSPGGLSRPRTASSNSGSSSSSRTVRKPTPPLFTAPSPAFGAYDDDSRSQTTFGRRSSLPYAVDPQSKASIDTLRRETSVDISINTPRTATYNPFEPEMDPLPIRSGKSRGLQQNQSRPSTSQSAVSKAGKTSKRNSIVRGDTPAPYSPALTEASWMDKDYVSEAKLEAVLKVNIANGKGLSRMETMGNAPRRNTPTPLHIGTSDRKSMAVGIIMPTYQQAGVDVDARRKFTVYGNGAFDSTST